MGDENAQCKKRALLPVPRNYSLIGSSTGCEIVREVFGRGGEWQEDDKFVSVCSKVRFVIFDKSYCNIL